MTFIRIIANKQLSDSDKMVMIKKLREMVGIDLMLCKKALDSTDYDIIKANDYLVKYLKNGKLWI